MSEMNFILFRPTRLEVPCTFLYPADWQVREIVANGGVEVFIVGPADSSRTYAASFTVRMSSSEQRTLEAAAAALLSRYHSAPGFRELGQARGTVAGRWAVEIGISYLTPLPLNNINAQLTRIIERHIFLKQRDQLVELLYAATEEDYPRWLPAFQTLVQTFTFETVVEPAAFLPLVTAAMPQYAHEQAAEYKTKQDKSDGQSE